MVFRVSVSLVVLCVLLAADQHNVGLLTGWGNSTRSGGGGNESRDGSENATDQDGNSGQDDTGGISTLNIILIIVCIILVIVLLGCVGLCWFLVKCYGRIPSEHSRISPPRPRWIHRGRGQSRAPCPDHPDPRQIPPGTDTASPLSESIPLSKEQAFPSPEPVPPGQKSVHRPNPNLPAIQPFPVPLDDAGSIPPPGSATIPLGKGPVSPGAGLALRSSSGIVPQSAVQGRPQSIVAQVLSGSPAHQTEAPSVGDPVEQAAEHSSPLVDQQAVPPSLSSQMDQPAVLEDCLSAQGQSRETPPPSAQCSSPPPPSTLVLGGEQYELDSLNVTQSTLLTSSKPLPGKDDDVYETRM